MAHFFLNRKFVNSAICIKIGFLSSLYIQKYLFKHNTLFPKINRFVTNVAFLWQALPFCDERQLFRDRQPFTTYFFMLYLNKNHIEKEIFMKRTLFCILTITCFLLSACADNTNTASNTSSSAAPVLHKTKSGITYQVFDKPISDKEALTIPF